MKSRILIYTPDAGLREAFATWSREVDLDEVIIAQEPKEIVDAAGTGDLFAVILDDSNANLSLSSLTSELAQSQPRARILVFPPENASDHSEVNTSSIFGFLSKPFSPEELETALQGSVTFATTEALNTAGPVLAPPRTQSENIPCVAADIGFLKGWILKVEEEKPTDTAAENYAISELEISHKPAEEAASIVEVKLENSEPGTRVEAENQPTVTVGTEVIMNTSRIETIIPGSRMNARIDPTPPAEPETGNKNRELHSPVNFHSLRLPYSCVLIPHDPQHFLTRDLAERLGLMLPQLHLKRGWRVIGTAIRPQYMQWQAALPLDISPAEAVQEIKKETSRWILANHPELKYCGSEEDFWAPGYLVLSGEYTIPPAMIHEYMHRARNVQA